MLSFSVKNLSFSLADYFQLKTSQNFNSGKSHLNTADNLS